MFATVAIHTPRISRTMGGGEVSRIAGAVATGAGAVGFDTGAPDVEQAADASPAARTTPWSRRDASDRDPLTWRSPVPP